MNRIFIRSFLLLAAVCFSAFISTQACAQVQDPAYPSFFTDQELDNLLAPIALYPDPLLAQILPATTYPEEVADVAARLNSGENILDIDGQSWAESVKAVAHYPAILQMMAENMDWTANLGDAFLNQPQDVTNSIQRLRWQARAVGNLVSNSEQTVIIEGDYIQIVPAQPQYVYIPQYDPSIVYYEQHIPSAPPLVTFEFGLVIGSWLSMDFDWGRHTVIYHGWNRPGWVNHARPYVHQRNVYINQSRPFINQTWKHDYSHGDPVRYLASRPSGPKFDQHRRTGEIRGQVTEQPRPAHGLFGSRGDTRAYSDRGRESRGIASQQPAPSSPSMRQRPSVPTPMISQRPTTPAPGSQRPAPVAPQIGGSPPVHPGPAHESVQPGRTPSVTFGGYRGADEARTQSLRGQASRQSTERISPSLSPAPESRGRVPSGGTMSRGGQRKER